MNKEDVLMIKWLESKIEDCDNLSGMEREKWAFQQCLKNARKLFDKTVAFLEGSVSSENLLKQLNEVDSLKVISDEAAVLTKSVKEYKEAKALNDSYLLEAEGILNTKISEMKICPFSKGVLFQQCKDLLKQDGNK